VATSALASPASSTGVTFGALLPAETSDGLSASASGEAAAASAAAATAEDGFDVVDYEDDDDKADEARVEEERPLRRQKRLDSPGAASGIASSSTMLPPSSSSSDQPRSLWDEPVPRAVGDFRRAEAASLTSSAIAPPIVDVPAVFARPRLSTAAMLPLWKEVRLAQLSPTELLVVESDGLVPAALLLRAYRIHHLALWEVPRQMTSMSERLQLWRRLPAEMEALCSHSEGRHPLLLVGAEAALRVWEPPQGGQQPPAPVQNVRLAEVCFLHGPHPFALQPTVRNTPSGPALTIAVVHRPAAHQPAAVASLTPRIFEVGLILTHPHGTHGVFDQLSPVTPQAAADGGAAAEPIMSRVTLLAGKVADLLSRGFLLPNGDLPLTILLQEPVRDKPIPMRRGRSKPIAGRPTSIQPWQYEREMPPLRHWSNAREDE